VELESVVPQVVERPLVLSEQQLAQLELQRRASQVQLERPEVALQTTDAAQAWA
jgi:hypothetical protein